ncbi:MAG: ATP-binding protein [Leptolyngbyaceae cyanobacterium]
MELELDTLTKMTETLQVLIVDDDEVDRIAVRRHLTKACIDANVTEAQDADTALSYLHQQTFSCIFLDYRLPDKNGVDLVKQIRFEGITAPVIILTGQGDEQTAVDIMKAGASDYLSKSRLSSESLSRSIRNAMKVYKAEQRTQDAQKQLRQTNILLRQQNKELEEQRHQIEQQNLQLLETSRLKSEFLATVTHEIRTPLNAIMGFSQVLKSEAKGSLNDYQRSMVDRIFTNGENLLALVNDILDMSTIEADRLEFRASHFDISELIQTTIAELRSLADKKNLKVQTFINLKDSEVYNDPKRLKQILVNLISNAIKFTDVGYVKIEVNAAALNSIEIIVEDTGIGIAPEQLSRIFQPFRQGDQTTQRKYAGTGLGLAIVYSLVSMMEGIVTVESQVGKGTIFRLHIPRGIFQPKR